MVVKIPPAIIIDTRMQGISEHHDAHLFPVNKNLLSHLADFGQ